MSTKQARNGHKANYYISRLTLVQLQYLQARSKQMGHDASQSTLVRMAVAYLVQQLDAARKLPADSTDREIFMLLWGRRLRSAEAGGTAPWSKLPQISDGPESLSELIKDANRAPMQPFKSPEQPMHE